MDWLRLYVEVLNDPKVQLLPAELFKTWVNLLIVARIHDGLIPDIETAAFQLRTSPEVLSPQLEKLGPLIDWQGRSFAPHNWTGRQFRSDNSSQRVQRWREKQAVAGNVTRNVSETVGCNVSETGIPEQNRTEQNRVIPPLSPQTQNGTNTNGDGDFEGQVDTLYARHPKKRNKPLVVPALHAALRRASFAAINRAHEVLCKSEDWMKQGGRFAPKLDEWLADDGWTAVASKQAPSSQYRDAPTVPKEFLNSFDPTTRRKGATK